MSAQTYASKPKRGPRAAERMMRLLVLMALLASLLGAPAGRAQAAAPQAVDEIANLTASADTYLNGGSTTTNYGGSTTISINGGSGTGSDRGALLKWDLSAIPANADVTAASITLNVTDTSTYAYPLYKMLRAWVEGNGTTGSGATWATYDGTNNWGTAGAASTSSDRDTTNLWNSSTTSWNATGPRTVTLNANGLTVLEGWISSPATNYGVTIQYYSTADSLVFSSRDSTTPANRPTLNITYTVPGPTITTTGTLSAFSTTPGTPSAAQTYTVSGSNLTADILITPPAGFELSTDGVSYAATLTLAQSGGTVATTTIYVRLTGAAVGSYSGDIAHTSAGATTANVAASGEVALCITQNLTAAEDTYVSAADVTFNNGGNVSIHVDNTTGTSRRGALLKWDLSGIPANSIVSAASMTVSVTDASPLVFNLYNMRRTWIEGTSTQAASTTSANWNTYNGVNAWGSAGISSTTLDREDTNLWGATTTSFSTTGSKTVDFNSSGVAAVQGWISTPASNYGVTMQNYSGTTTNAVYFSSSEFATTANRPKLNVTYCASTGPSITTGGSLSAFSAPIDVYSAEQSYTVTGYNLTEGITVTAPADFEVSATGGGSGFGSTITLGTGGGTVYVRFTRASAGTTNGNISHASAGATTVNLAVSGTAIQYYTLTAGSGGNGTVTLNPAGGSYAAGTTVTLTPVANGGYAFDSWSGANAGDIINTAGVYTIVMNANKSVTANFVVSLCTDVSLVIAEDTWIRNSQPTMNYGASETLQVSPFSSYPQGSLYKWDLGGIPTNATVDTASLTFFVTDSSAYAFSLYNMRRAWVEGTGTSAGAEGVGASWNFYDLGVTSWGTAGAANTGSDRYNTNLWDANAATFGTIGSVTIPLNTSGVGVVQDWIDGGLTNYGLTLQNYSGATTGDYWIVSSSEAATAANRPKLNLHYCTPPSGPTITTSGTLSAFSAILGTPSAAQTYTVAGTSLSEGILITPPSGFELSTDGVGYAATLTLAPSGGSVAATTIYVRLTGAAEGSYSGNIAHTSAGATTKNVAAGGVVAQCATQNLVAAEDTYISEYNVTNNYGGVDLFKVTNNNAGNQRGALIRWDLSSIPTNVVVDTASLTLYVSTASTQAYNLYNMRRSWVEGTTNPGAASSTSANWNTFNGTTAWETVGAAGTTFDRYDTNLWSTTTSTFTPTGSKTISLNTDGIAVVQGWISTPANNYGLTMQSYSTTSGSDDLQISSSENATVNNRPMLNLHYCAPAVPTITTSGALSAFSAAVGAYSAEQSYSVAGSNLSGNLTISAPADFEISTTSGSGFGASVTLTPSGGSVASTPIYVRFRRMTAGTTNGNISHASAGAATVNVAVSGTAANGAPTVTPVSPADDATGVSLPPTLQAAVSDPDGDTLDVSFYGRPVGGGEEFMLALIPDSQNLDGAERNAQTGWIVSNKTANNIVFVTTAGDMVNTANSVSEYTIAAAAIDLLDGGGVWYSVASGNHDYPGYASPLRYPDYFGAARYSDYEVGDGYWFGGAYNDYNTYSLFSAGGMDFILINLQYQPTTAVLDWADGLLSTYASRRAIVEQHDILNVDNSWVNQASFNALRDHANLFMMLSGHMHTGSDGAAYRQETGTDGHTIHVVMADYQDYNSAGNTGYLRLFRFAPADDMIYMTTYSPVSGTALTSTGNYDQADLAYAMDGGAAFALIGTVNDVASGATASISWPGLLNDTEYEWYAVADDGSTTTTGATWSFTTGVGNNQPPVISEGTAAAVTMSEDGAPTAFSLTLHAGDANPGDTLTWSIVDAADNGTATAAGTGFLKAIGYAPNANYNGSDSFTVQVSDGYPGGTDTIVVHVTIDPVNDAPVLDAIGPKSTAELALLSFSATATDIDGPALTYSLADGGGAVPSGAAITSGGAFTWTPTEAQGPGTYTFDVCVSDGSATDCETITVTVNEVNTAPVLGAIGPQTVAELSLLSFNAGATDADLPANTLTFSLADGGGAVPSGAAITGGGAFTWTPTADQGPAIYTFDVCVGDGSAADCETITVTVTEGNAAPVITEGDSESVTMTKNGTPTAFSLTLHATDANSGDTLTWSIADDGDHGTATASGTGLSKAIGYSPAADYTGSDSFIVQVSDGHGGSDAITVNVTIYDTHSIDLVVGWNLVSFNLHPADSDIADVLATIAGNYNLVYAWVNGAWQHYDPAQGAGNTLLALDETKGFWVEMTAADTLIVAGTPPVVSGIPLLAGWNLVSFPGASSLSLPQAFTDNDVALGNLNLVMAMHAVEAADPWLLYDPTAPAYVNDLAAMTPGWGYWISVDADDLWTVP